MRSTLFWAPALTLTGYGHTNLFPCSGVR